MQGLKGSSKDLIQGLVVKVKPACPGPHGSCLVLETSG